jgi:hypothetical protein
MLQLNGAPQRPLRVWLQGLELGLASFRNLIALTTMLGFISLLPTIYMALQLGDAEISPESMLQLLKQGHFILSILLLQSLVFVLGLFVNALVILRLDHAARGATRAHDMGFIYRKIISLILAGLLVFITVVIGLLIAAFIGAISGTIAGLIFGHAIAIVVTEACIFTALIYIAIYILFFQFAIVLDDKGPVSALNYSCALVFQNWWRTFLVLLYTALIIVGILVMAALPLAVVMPITHWLPELAAADTGRTLLIKGVVKLVATAVFAPFTVGILYMLYQDLKVRYAIRSTPTGSVQA